METTLEIVRFARHSNGTPVKEIRIFIEADPAFFDIENDARLQTVEGYDCKFFFLRGESLLFNPNDYQDEDGIITDPGYWNAEPQITGSEYTVITEAEYDQIIVDIEAAGVIAKAAAQALGEQQQQEAKDQLIAEMQAALPPCDCEDGQDGQDGEDGYTPDQSKKARVIQLLDRANPTSAQAAELAGYLGFV